MKSKCEKCWVLFLTAAAGCWCVKDNGVQSTNIIIAPSIVQVAAYPTPIGSDPGFLLLCNSSGCVVPVSRRRDIYLLNPLIAQDSFRHG